MSHDKSTAGIVVTWKAGAADESSFVIPHRRIAAAAVAVTALQGLMISAWVSGHTPQSLWQKARPLLAARPDPVATGTAFPVPVPATARALFRTPERLSAEPLPAIARDVRLQWDADG